MSEIKELLRITIDLIKQKQTFISPNSSCLILNELENIIQANLSDEDLIDLVQRQKNYAEKKSGMLRDKFLLLQLNYFLEEANFLLTQKVSPGTSISKLIKNFIDKMQDAKTSTSESLALINLKAAISNDRDDASLINILEKQKTFTQQFWSLFPSGSLFFNRLQHLMSVAKHLISGEKKEIVATAEPPGATIVDEKKLDPIHPAAPISQIENPEFIKLDNMRIQLENEINYCLQKFFGKDSRINCSWRYRSHKIENKEWALDQQGFFNHYKEELSLASDSPYYLTLKAKIARYKEKILSNEDFIAYKRDQATKSAVTDAQISYLKKDITQQKPEFKKSFYANLFKDPKYSLHKTIDADNEKENANMKKLSS